MIELQSRGRPGELALRCGILGASTGDGGSIRAAIATLALLVVAASPGGGCSSADRPTAIDDECEGLPCGESCAFCPDGATRCPVPTFAPTACNARGECVTADTFSCDPLECAGKTCGTECSIEPPCRSSEPPCAMPTVLGRCDPGGQCITGEPACDPCAGKTCHSSCTLCPPDASGCYETAS